MPIVTGLQVLSRTAGGRDVPPARERAQGRLPREDPFIGWTASIGVAMLAFFLRLWNLGQPRSFAFDETYYAKDAWSLLHDGYTRNYTPKANDQILAGHTLDQWSSGPSMGVHPEVGKWMISLGEQVFGMEPFGWRIMSALVGSLMVLVMCRLARRLTGSTLLGCVAGLLLCFDGLHLVLSRLALLDIFEAFWLLCAVAACVNDRDWLRRRMAERGLRWYWFRPWLLVAGICFGLAVGVKWGALYPLAAFGPLVMVWAANARRMFGQPQWAARGLVDGAIAFVHLVLVGFVVYVSTWTGWLVHAGEYEQHLSNTQYTTYGGGTQWDTATEPDASGAGEAWQSLRSLASYHQDVWVFHTKFLNDSDHVYESRPRGWLLLNRPVGVDAQLDIKPGTQGCEAPEGSDCLRQVLLLGTPVLWWGGVIALLWSVVSWVARRDWRHGLVVVGVAATWLPWFLYDDRPIFSFYAINILPFTVISLTLLIGQLISAPGPSARRTWGVVAAGSFFVLVLLNFAYFWPIWTDELITHSEWAGRMWFKRWI